MNAPESNPHYNQEIILLNMMELMKLMNTKISKLYKKNQTHITIAKIGFVEFAVQNQIFEYKCARI